MTRCYSRELLICLLLALSFSNVALANDAAYVLLYHHVAADTPASTSVTPDQFAVQLQYLVDNRYKVIPLEKILSALKKGRKLPPRTVAITFDDGYPSVLQNALPMLAEHKFPFTVFVSTEDVDRTSSDFIDQASASYLTWDQLRELEKHRGTIANHGNKHQHMLAREAKESDSQWRERIMGDIKYAQSRLETELKKPARLLSYPYGEFDAQLVALAEELDYLAVGQQSGPVGVHSNAYAAPRFPQAREFADLPQFAEKLNTRPFDIISPALPATLLPPGEDQPTLELQMKEGPFRASHLTCYVSGQGTAKVRWQNASSTQVKITARDALPVGRTNYTCTAPHESVPSLYYWYTHVFMRREADGSWYQN